jgi:hypothetical protein
MASNTIIQYTKYYFKSGLLYGQVMCKKLAKTQIDSRISNHNKTLSSVVVEHLRSI